MRALFVLFVSSLTLGVLTPAGAAAQESNGAAALPGVRAAGMGGAFTAVADDASAVFWNPAGLASGSFFSLVVDRNSADQGSATLVSLGTPPLGLSYYRTVAAPNLADGQSLIAHHAGVTLLQSVGERLTVGGTFKLVHGVVRADGEPAVSTNKFDADLAVMARGSLGRLGLTVHNATEPRFAGPHADLILPRQVRAGIAINAGSDAVVAGDVDLTGDLRQAALGAEAHPIAAAWLRGGVHWNTRGGASAPIGSVGGSYAVYGSTVADAQVSFGSDKGNRGWGVGLRVVF